MDKKEWEATLPKKSLEEEQEARRRKEEALAAPKTPALNRFNSKKKKNVKNNKPASKTEDTPSKGDKDASGKEAGDKKPLKLPEASYWIIDDYDISDAPARPNSYYRYKSPCFFLFLFSSPDFLTVGLNVEFDFWPYRKVEK